MRLCIFRLSFTPHLSPPPRVTDDKDRLLLGTLLRRIVSPETAERPRGELLTRRRRVSDEEDGGGMWPSLGGMRAAAGRGGNKGPLVVEVPDTTTLEG